MPPFAECCAVIPCNTIEDFPTRLDSAGARSLLGGLTAIWHPRLIAASGRTPTWYRADESPASIRCEAGHGESGQYRLIVVPETCVSVLSSELRDVIESAPFGVIEPESPEYAAELVVRVKDRADAIAQIRAACQFVDDKLHGTLSSESDADIDGSNGRTDFDETNDWMVHCEPSELTNGRTIDVSDFFALGYTWWQIQVLTRRLRYTSNLDQIHFESQLQSAANGITSGDAKLACDSLHDCFDALAEERDHYFSSDPSLIDLTLLTPGTVSKWVDSLSLESVAIKSTAAQLATPGNVLIDEDVANAVESQLSETKAEFCEALATGKVGWCGGGPSASFQHEHHSVNAIEQRVADGMAAVRQLTGELPAVYARLGGGVAAQWLSAIASSGFQGVVPIDFLNGRGFESESKVIMGEGSFEMEALTAKPIDGNDDSDFLTLGTRLGEAIDGGEIATGLLVHWPGEGCDSFQDVKRAASWTLALGKFWKIDEYFTDGERPYHHGETPKATSSSDGGIGDGEQLADEFRRQTELNLRGMLALVDPETASDPSPEASATDLRTKIATAIGYEIDSRADAAEAPLGSALLIRPAHPASRESVTLTSNVTTGDPSVFHATSENNRTVAFVDVPAWGFAAVGKAAPKMTPSSAAGSPNLVQKLGRWFRRPSRKIIEGTQLSNEFMEVSINPEHGGIDGVYSGRGRGNRFSTRLIRTPNSSKDPLVAICESFEVIQNTRASAVVELRGQFAAGDGAESTSSAWSARYQLDRGSRRLQCWLQSVASETKPDESPWKSLASLRIAVADATPVIRSINSERLQRTSARHFSSSLGFVVDEADERTTLVASDRPTLHRRLEDRFVDTLITSPKAKDPSNVDDWHRFEFGFDVPNGVSAAKSLANRRSESHAGVPITTPKATGVPQQGWLVHVSPMSLEAQVVGVSRVDGSTPSDAPAIEPKTKVANADAGLLAIHFRIIQSAARATKSSLRFCRPVHAVFEISSVSRPLENQTNSIELADLESLAISQSLTVEADRVRWNQPAHGVTHLVVLFPIGVVE